LFGSVQLGSAGGETGFVGGTGLGVGWRVVGDVTILAGFSLTRLPTLRDDLLREFDSTADKRLRLPAGENSESIKGTESVNAFMLALAVPVALKSVFGK
jgi:hypothetical protein